MPVRRCLNPTCELHIHNFEFTASSRLCPQCKQPTAVVGGVPAEAQERPSPPSRQPSLRLTHTSGREFVVTGDEAPIVRTVQQVPANTINLCSLPQADIVSKKHAVIRWNREFNTYLLQDLNSTNGTFVNQRRLQPGEPVVLNHGDRVRLGNSPLFEFSVQLL